MLLKLLLNREPYKVTFGRLTEVWKQLKMGMLVLGFCSREDFRIRWSITIECTLISTIFQGPLWWTHNGEQQTELSKNEWLLECHESQSSWDETGRSEVLLLKVKHTVIMKNIYCIGIWNNYICQFCLIWWDGGKRIWIYVLNPHVYALV